MYALLWFHPAFACLLASMCHICLRSWYIFVCVCDTASYKMYLKLQTVVSGKKAVFWVLTCTRGSGKAFFRLNSEGWEGGSHVKVGETAIQTEGTEWLKVWGGEEVGVPGNWRGASIGERSCMLIRPFRWGALSCRWSQGRVCLSLWEDWSPASLTYKCQQKTSPTYSLWADDSFGSGFLISHVFGSWDKERVHEDKKWKATFVYGECELM